MAPLGSSCRDIVWTCPREPKNSPRFFKRTIPNYFKALRPMLSTNPTPATIIRQGQDPKAAHGPLTDEQSKQVLP